MSAAAEPGWAAATGQDELERSLLGDGASSTSARGRPSPPLVLPFASPSLAACAAAGLDPAVASSTLLRLAFDRLTQSAVFLRSLALVEDWAHGLAGAEGGVNTSDPLPHLADPAAASWRTHRWSWERLALQSARIVLGDDAPCAAALPSWYGGVDRTLLSAPYVSVWRSLRVPLLRHFMAASSLPKLSRNTICIVTGALLQCVIAHRHGALPALLAELRVYNEEVRAWGEGGGKGDGDADGDGDGDGRRRPLLLPTLADDLLPPGVFPEAGGDDDEEEAAEATSAPAPPDARTPVFASYSRALILWLEYHSLREREQRGLAAFSGYTWAEWRVVGRALLGLGPGDGPASAIVDLSGDGQPQQLHQPDPYAGQWAQGLPAEWVPAGMGVGEATRRYWEACRIVPA